jgi:hypothetical protein
MLGAWLGWSEVEAWSEKFWTKLYYIETRRRSSRRNLLVLLDRLSKICLGYFVRTLSIKPDMAFEVICVDNSKEWTQNPRPGIQVIMRHMIRRGLDTGAPKTCYEEPRRFNRTLTIWRVVWETVYWPEAWKPLYERIGTITLRATMG